MEVFSKAIHGGQYPLSLVAMGPSVSYPGGIYGSTMTANPRALAVGTEVLKKLTPEFQLHVRRQVRTAACSRTAPFVSSCVRVIPPRACSLATRTDHDAESAALACCARPSPTRTHTLTHTHTHTVAHEQGDNFKAALTSLWEKYPSVVSGVSGTGLLCAMDLNEKYDVLAVEKQCRMRGLNVIHGGKNALVRSLLQR